MAEKMGWLHRKRSEQVRRDCSLSPMHRTYPPCSLLLNELYPDVWLVTVTLLWNTFGLNVVTAEVRQRYYDAENLR